jgi:hypothetical protein
MSDAIRTQARAGAGAARKAPAHAMQRRCACGAHTPSGGSCGRCGSADVQAPLLVGREGDHSESEAERAADAVVSGKSISFALTAAPIGPARLEREAADGLRQEAPFAVHAALEGGGRALDATSRAMMEARFHRDFGQVRVHDDARAAVAADSIGAAAFTRGQDVVFARGQFQPQTTQGLHLLAHELAHVVQQRGATRSMTLQRQPARSRPAPARVPKFHQDLIDQLATIRAQAAQQSISISPSELPLLEALVALCDAVDAGRATDIHRLLDDVVKIGGTFLYRLALTNELMIELPLRIAKLGLDGESARVRTFIDASMNYSSYHKDGAKTRNLEYLTRFTKFALAGVKLRTVPELVASFDLLMRAFTPTVGSLYSVHVKGTMPNRSFTGLYLKPGMDPAQYESELIDLMQKQFIGIEMVFQMLSDLAVAELSQGKGSATLATLDQLLRRLATVVQSRQGREIDEITFSITSHTMTGKGVGRLDDAFIGKARAADITTFDAKQDYIEERRGSLKSLFDVRRQQVDFLIRIYGATSLVDKAAADRGLKKDEANANAQAIAAMGGKGFSLASNDDWRNFVLAKFKQLTAGRSADVAAQAAALDSVIALLFDYLRVFTLHPEVTNIYDAGSEQDNYLEKSFPRALSGQLLHDCGVYAIRVAYILSRVRKELGLRFHLVTLPQHVVLVIEGDKVPSYIVSNDEFVKLDTGFWKQRQGWKSQFRSGDKTKQDDTQFIGEVAAGMYMRDTPDTPFAVKDISGVGANAAADKKKLWSDYKSAAGTPLFSGTKGKALSSRYYQASQAQSGYARRELARLWASCESLWTQLQTRLAQDGKGGRITGQKLHDALDAHLQSFDGAAAPAATRRTQLQQSNQAMTDELSKDPALVAKGVRIASGERARTQIIGLAQVALDDYRTSVQALVQQSAAAPSKSWLVVDVNSALAPPFITSSGTFLPMSELRQKP